MKKVISFVLVLAMLATMTVMFSACGGGGGGKKTVEDDGRPVKFSVIGYETQAEKKEVYEQYHAKWEATAKEVANAEIDWIGGDMAMIMASGDYPDIILKTAFQNVDVARYASQGVLIDLTPYISEENTPNIWEMFTKHPTTKAIATSPDGGIYALPSYSGNPGSFIETFWWINDAWLKKLNLETPTNLDELYEVLKAFKTGDPNGNGKADEIPMTFYNEGAYNYPETLLSAWGVSTKFGMYDAYLNVQQGKVNFTPMMDEWKEMIKYYAKLYKEGLLDIQCFTYESNTFNSTVKSETPVVGVMFGKENPFGVNADQYKVMLPLRAHADSPDPIMHIHPGVIGTRNACHITSNCENPAAAMRWIDTFYDAEQTITNWYGEAGDGPKDTFTYIENPDYSKGEANYMWRDPAENGYASLSEMYNYNTTYGPHMLGYWDQEELRGKLVQDCDAFAQYDDLYAMYEPYMDKETWPRPYYDPDDSTTVSSLQTDIFNWVEKNKANWIMGRADVEKEWDSYIAQLKKLKVEEYLEIQQGAYDIYQEALAEITK